MPGKRPQVAGNVSPAGMTAGSAIRAAGITAGWPSRPSSICSTRPVARRSWTSGRGQGVLAPYIAATGARYTGLDASPRLIEIARRRHRGRGRFLLGDARRLREVPALSAAQFDAGVFMLCLQDMDPLEPVLESVAWALRPTSRIVMLMTHPSFRQPRHSGWGFDASRKLRYRRVDAYLTPMSVPLGSAADGRRTRAYHRPLSSYINTLGSVGYAVDAMLELPDLPPERRPRRSGPPSRAGAEDEAEIPLFLAIRARRL